MRPRSLITMGAALAGSQNRLAHAIGYSARTISNARTGVLPLSSEARARIVQYILSGGTAAPPALRLGRKPKEIPLSGSVTVRLPDELASAYDTAAEEHPHGRRGVVEDAIVGYLAAHPERRIKTPEPVAGDVSVSTTRIDPGLLRCLAGRIRGPNTRGDHVRAALTDYLHRRARRSSRTPEGVSVAA